MLRYVAPVFVGAFLLFQVQPLIARYILPWFGGTPAVWTTCMLFFEIVLLLGYAYAHLVISKLTPRGQTIVHSALLVLTLAVMGVLTAVWGVPIIPGANWKPSDPGMPVLRILELLTVVVGLPYFVLSTTSPLLQAWFARTNPGASPYRLYTLSNIGSLLALLTYPFIVEPALTMRAQAGVWSVGYLVFVACYVYCAARVWSTCRNTAAGGKRRPDAATACELDPAPPPSRMVRALWVGLPTVASVLLLATTNQMCQEVAVIPFLWILPLSLYLLSFIICFDNPRWYVRSLFVPALILAVPALIALMVKQEDYNIRLQVGVYSVGLFICCMVCHGELVALKPAPKYLTSFYLAVAAGGAIGGVFVGLIAPFIFKEYFELPLGLLLCWLLALGVIYFRALHWTMPTSPQHSQLRQDLAQMLPTILRTSALFLAGATLCAPILGVHLYDKYAGNRHTISRNFYGILRVKDNDANDPKWHSRALIHGRITHGFQYLAADKRDMACSYYGYESGVGLAVLNHPRRQSLDPARRNLRIGVIGLGTGTMAVYAKKGDYVQFYDINPAVLHIARDSGDFTYLADCKGKVDVKLGDARVSMENELKQGSQEYDVIVLDAFSSDAIPAHLLTKEALELYLQHLRGTDGVICVHVSNRALDLKPVVWKLAENLDLNCALIVDPGDQVSTYTSDWMLLTRSRDFLNNPKIADRATPRKDMRDIGLWTDDYHNLYQILR
jgi:spermidine synthase